MLSNSELEDILERVSSGDLSVQTALKYCQHTEDIGFAIVDHDRQRRCGFPEVIFSEAKTPEHSQAIARRLVEKNGFAFLTRVPDSTRDLLLTQWSDAEYNPLSKTMIVGKVPTKKTETSSAKVLIVSAGTSDIPVAEEAGVTARVMGCDIEYLHDAGIAGLHRILSQGERLQEAEVIIVTAGMEGALPSVVAGLVDSPVIAVPTSIGYGASFKGIAALLGMLTSCANGVGVVNIDNGFGAGCLAAKIVNSGKRDK